MLGHSTNSEQPISAESQFILQTVSVSATGTVTLKRAVGKKLAVSAAGAVTTTKRVNKLLAVAASGTITIRKAIAHTLLVLASTSVIAIAGKVFNFLAGELQDIAAFFGFRGRLDTADPETFFVRPEIHAFDTAVIDSTYTDELEAQPEHQDFAVEVDGGLTDELYVTSEGNEFTVAGERRNFRANPRQRKP